MYFPQKDIDTIHVCTEEIISDQMGITCLIQTHTFYKSGFKQKLPAVLILFLFSLHLHRSRRYWYQTVSAIKKDHSSGNQS